MSNNLYRKALRRCYSQRSNLYLSKEQAKKIYAENIKDYCKLKGNTEPMDDILSFLDEELTGNFSDSGNKAA